MFPISVFTDIYQFALLIVAAVTFLYLMLHYGLSYLRVALFRKKQQDTDTVPDADLPAVSVVMIATNNANMLSSHLTFLLEQNYPNFEVVVVDYLSTDDTQYVLRVASTSYKHFKMLRMGNDINLFHGKKYPLSLGIRSAKNDIIVLTEPQCVPCSKNWLREIAKKYRNDDTQIVLGYTNVISGNTLLGWLQQYENLVYHCGIFQNAIMGHPSTGCGLNLSHRKSFFFSRIAFINNYMESDGADDMFVHQNATKHNTSVVLSNDSFVNADAQSSFYDWHLVRRHRIATYSHHRSIHKFRSIIYPLSILLFYVSCILMFFSPVISWILPVALLVCKITWQIVSLYKASQRFQTAPVYWCSPLFELYFLLANTILPLTPLYARKGKRH